MKPFVILNPAAGSVNDLEQLLKQIERLKPAAVRLTRKTGGAKACAAAALRQGCKYLIAAGGDGTLNEVINGIAPHAARVRVGLLPLGTGNDFARCWNLPSDVEANIDILKAGKVRKVDLVRVRSDRTRYLVKFATRKRLTSPCRLR